MALAALGVPYEVVATAEIEPNVIIAYAAMRNKLQKNEATIDEMKELLKSRNIGWDFQKNKSVIDRMKRDKLEMLYNATINANNLGDISKINTEDIPDHDLFTMSSPCFTGDTLVLTENGYMPIKDITIGTKVVTHTGELKEIINFFNNGEKDIYKISGMCFDEIRTTYNHKFYVKKRITKMNYIKDEQGIKHGKRVYTFTEPTWTEYKDLQVGDYLGIPINNKSIIPTWEGFKTSWEHRNPRSKTNQTITVNYQTNHLSQYMDNKDFWWLIGRYLGDGWIKKGNGICICCAKYEKQEIEPVIKRLGFNYCCTKRRTTFVFQIAIREIEIFCEQFGSGAENKHLTSTILDLPIDLLKSFLEGYMSADGTVEPNKKYPNAESIYQFNTISKQLSYDITQCIFKLYHHGCSLMKVKKSPTYVIEGRTVNQKDYYQCQYRINDTIQKQSYCQDGYIWYPIRKLEKCNYKETVYDIEVKDNHSFIANNAIVHNCQSFSVSGKGEGGEWVCKDCGTIINPFKNSFTELCPNCHSTNINKPTSSLLWECVKVIKIKKPSIVMMENVKNILNKKHKPTFDKWCEYLENQGYENRYTVLNAQELAIPQNRERMIMISVRKDSHWYSDLHFDKFEFPKKMDLKYCLRDVLQPENEIREKFYLPQHIVDRFQEQYIGKNIVGTTKPRENSIGQRDVIYSTNNIMGTLTATDYKDPKHILLHMGDCEYEIVDIEDKETLEKILKSTPCVVASRGRYNENGTISQHYEANTDKVSNTLTTVEKDNYLLDEVNKQDNKEDNLIQIGSLKLLGLLPYAKMHDQSGRVYATNGIAPTITTMGGGNLEPKIMCCVWSDDKEKLIIKYFTIRKLTPIECGRLMGVPDALINKAIEADLSDSALYHMFGNSIVTTMLMGTFGKLFGVEDYETKIRNLTDGIFGNKR